jgi:RNA polymerase sigma factor (sigma-70 family)
LENTQLYSEEQLVELLRAGNNSGFVHLYLHYSWALYGIIHAIVPERDLADDILQEVFINIFRKINTYDESKSKLFTWMARIARNFSIDTLQSKNYRNRQMNVDLYEANELAEPFQIGNIDHSGLRGIVLKLEPKYSNLLELNYFYGFTSLEISKMLDMPLGTVKTRIRTGLLQLRKILEDDYF